MILHSVLPEPVPTPSGAWLCSQCGEMPSVMVKIGTSDGWCTRCLDDAAEPTPTPAADVPNIFTLGHEGRMFLLSWLQVEVLKGTPIDVDTWRGAWGQAADYQTVVNARRVLDGAAAS